ncbi:MAG: hypothetical protein E6H42_09500 [Betaproteobacteria bacterium]|nr:MAG: hypothetical protein E6H42_09500 [Betaproteobacteria bacterium]
MVPSSARQDGSWRPPFIRETGRASPCSRPCSRNEFYLPACRILALVRCGVIVHMPGSASPRPGDPGR